MGNQRSLNIWRGIIKLMDRKEYMRNYMREYLKKMPAAQKRKRLLKQLEWRAANPDKCLAAKRKYNETHADERNAKEATETYKALRRKQRHTPTGKATTKRARAKQRGAVVATLTAREWREILEKYKHRCAYCRSETAPVEQEHVIPITRGGQHVKSNVVPSCRRCNLTKGCRTLDEWVNDILGGKK